MNEKKKYILTLNDAFRIHNTQQNTHTLYRRAYEPLFIVGHPIIINVLILRRWLNILKTPFGRVVSNIVPRFIYGGKE